MSRPPSSYASTKSRPGTADEDILNMFDDEQAAEGILKSLIDPMGLHVKWKQLEKRVQAAERGLNRATRLMNGMHQDYVPRNDVEAFKAAHEGRLSESERALAELRERADGLSQTSEEHGASLGSHGERLLCLEGQSTQLDNNLKELHEEVSRHNQALLGDIQQTHEKIDGKVQELHSELKAFRSNVDDGFVREDEQIGVTKQDMHAWVNEKLADLNEMLCREYIDETKIAQHRVELQAKIDEELVVPVRTDLSGLHAYVDNLKHTTDRSAGDLKWAIKGVEQKAEAFGEKVDNTTVELRDHIDQRYTKDEVEGIKANLVKSLTTAQGEVESLKGRVVGKLNEFLDHFNQMHQTLSDHEHCLQHHAEELENRCTKYELLLCRNQVTKCISKEDFDGEVGDVRKILSWQTDKIENFALTTAMMKPMGKAGGGKKAPRPPPSKESQGQEQRSLPGTPRAGSKGPNFSEVEVSRSEAPDVPEEEDEDWAEDLTSTLRKQIEGLSMGVLALAHLVLREPKVGSSRQARLAVEQDLIEQLKDLRHWVTHNAAPSGWSVDKLVSVALKCTHPVDGEPASKLHPQCSAGLVKAGKRLVDRPPEISITLASDSGKKGTKLPQLGGSLKEMSVLSAR